MVTAKAIAKKLGVSEAAVSIALNGRAGVSDSLRRKVRDTAQMMGYDFSRLSKKNRNEIVLIIFLKSGAVVGDTPFFEHLFKGIGMACRKQEINLTTVYSNTLDDLRSLLCTLPRDVGVIFLATEADANDCKPVVESNLPHVILDAYFEHLDSNYVLINNVHGAFVATNYLIRLTGKQPGYLRSSYAIANFAERSDGFYKALRVNGLSASNSIVHQLCPSTEGAYSDLHDLLSSGERIADCYFADNDLIAAGAIRALKEHGWRVPQDVAVIGFDDISLCECLDPPLSTVHVPKEYMGSQSVARLLSILHNGDQEKTKIEIDTQLVLRKSC